MSMQFAELMPVRTISLRLPQEILVGKPVALKAINLEDGWLGDPATWGKDGKTPTISPWKDFKGDRELACWFPTQRFAAVWRAFVRGSKDVAIAQPAALGDGQKFVSYSASKPIAVKVGVSAKITPTKIELWDAHQRLAERTSAPWDFEVSLKPGVHAIFAIVAAESGERCSRPHAIVVTE